MSRQLAITKRTTLEEFEGWGDDCYLIWRPFNYQDSKELSKREGVEKLNDDEGFEMILADVSKHIISGKIKILDEETNEPKLVDYEADDLRSMPVDFIMNLYGEMTGARFDDPKALETTPTINSEPKI